MGSNGFVLDPIDFYCVKKKEKRMKTVIWVCNHVRVNNDIFYFLVELSLSELSHNDILIICVYV